MTGSRDVMDLVDGGSLDDYIAQKRAPLTSAELLAIAEPILDAMEHAHTPLESSTAISSRRT